MAAGVHVCAVHLALYEPEYAVRSFSCLTRILS